MTPVLTITDLIKTFSQPGGGSLTVLDVPALQVAAGEQLALIGQSATENACFSKYC